MNVRISAIVLMRILAFSEVFCLTFFYSKTDAWQNMFYVGVKRK